MTSQYICGNDLEKCSILDNDSCCNSCKNFKDCFKEDRVCKLYNVDKRECEQGLMIKKDNISICKPIRSKEQIYKEKWLIQAGEHANINMELFKDRNTLKTLLGIEARMNGYENTEDYLNSLISDRAKKIYSFMKEE